MKVAAIIRYDSAELISSDPFNTGTNTELIPRAKPSEKNMTPMNANGNAKLFVFFVMGVNVLKVNKGNSCKVQRCLILTGVESFLVYHFETAVWNQCFRNSNSFGGLIVFQ